MTKNLLNLFCLLGILAQAQTNRVGVNTETPKATLDIRETPVNQLPQGTAQGVSFPNFPNEDRGSFTEIKEGTMIYNTTKKCLEIYTRNTKGILAWYCVKLVDKNVIDTQVDVTDYLVNGHQFNIPYEGNLDGAYSETRVSKTTPDGQTITLVIPAGRFSDTEGGKIPAYFEVPRGRYDVYCDSLRDFVFNVNMSGIPPFKVTLNVNTEACSIEATGSGANTITNGMPLSITYRGRIAPAGTPYNEIRITLPTLDEYKYNRTKDGNFENVTLVIPAGTFSGESGGVIPARYEVDGDGVFSPECLGATTLLYEFTIHGIKTSLLQDIGRIGCY